MDPQEITEELEHPGARKLLDSATLLRLAYNGSDGFPRVIPIGFYWNGNQIVVCTAATAPKVKALSSRPNIAMTIDAGDTPTEAKALLVRGLASVDIVDGVPHEYLAASTKALGADQVTEFERQVRSMYDQMARICIEPVWARFFDFGAGRLPSFLTKLASYAYRITCVEIGPALATADRANLADFPHVDVVESAFEAWDPPAGERFDLVFAATAWHWLDLEERYQRAWRLLRTGGHLAIWSAVHVFPEGGDPFFTELQDVYDEIGEGLPEHAVWPRPRDLPDDRAEIERSGFFEDVVVRHFDWAITYDADGYLRLLDTFSGHIAMEAWQRDRLYGEIRRRLEQRADGLMHSHWGAVLQVARRADAPSVP